MNTGTNAGAPLQPRPRPTRHALALACVLLATLLPALAQGPAPQARPDERPSTHGMLVAGTDVVYLSHLPMFHSPHDYQLIIEAELPAAACAAYRADVEQQDVEQHDVAQPAASKGRGLYTLAPTQRWVLPATIAPEATFQADLYRGHFERGGTPILRDITVTVRRVVHFRRFEAGRQPDPAQWIAFGRGREHFLAHRLEGAPDMDQVVEVAHASDEGAAVALPDAHELRVGDATPAGAVRRVLYTEYGDLAQ